MAGIKTQWMGLAAKFWMQKWKRVKQETEAIKNFRMEPRESTTQKI